MQVETSVKQFRVLVIDDDQAMGQRIRNYFEEHGFWASWKSNRWVTACLPVLRESSMVVVAQRGGQGCDLLRRIMSYSNVPVIVIVDRGSGVADGVLALEHGADDYLEEPVSLRELVARARTVLRGRHIGQAGTETHTRPDVCRFGGWQFDRHTRRLVDANGRAVRLSNREAGLLMAFLDSGGRPLTREQLLIATGMDEDVNDRSIDVQVLRLRRKLEATPETPRLIRTERGIGYVFALPVTRVERAWTFAARYRMSSAGGHREEKSAA
jgi:two-component system OmpR family response regulator